MRLEANEVLHFTCKADVRRVATGQESEGRSSLGSIWNISTLLQENLQKLIDEQRNDSTLMWRFGLRLKD